MKVGNNRDAFRIRQPTGVRLIQTSSQLSVRDITKRVLLAIIVIANKEDRTDKSHNQGTYYAYLRVTDDDIQPSENANPVKTLRMRYDAWKKAGSKPFNTVATVALGDTKR
jgi:hypothetical protein